MQISMVWYSRGEIFSLFAMCDYVKASFRVTQEPWGVIFGMSVPWDVGLNKMSPCSLSPQQEGDTMLLLYVHGKILRALDLQQPTAFTLHVCDSCIGLTDWLITVTAEKWRSQRVDKQDSLEYFILIGQSRHPAACFFLLILPAIMATLYKLSQRYFQAVMGEKKLFKTLNQFNQLLCKKILHLKLSKHCFWSKWCKCKVDTTQTCFYFLQTNYICL